MGGRELDDGFLFEVIAAIVESENAFASAAAEEKDVGGAISVEVFDVGREGARVRGEEDFDVFGGTLLLPDGKVAEAMAKAAGYDFGAGVVVYVGDGHVGKAREAGECDGGVPSVAARCEAAELAGQFVGGEGAADERDPEIRADVEGVDGSAGEFDGAKDLPGGGDEF